MLKWFRGSSGRRREVRRAVPRPRPTLPALLRRREVSSLGLFALLFAVVASALALLAAERPRHGVGQVLTEPVVARVTFRFEDEAGTRRNRAEARERAPAVYRPDLALRDAMVAELDRLVGLTADYKSWEDVPAAVRTEMGLPEEAWAPLQEQIVSGQPQPQWRASVEAFLHDLYTLAILAPEDVRREREAPARPSIVLMHPAPRTAAEVERHKGEILSTEEPDAISTALQHREGPILRNFRPQLRRVVAGMVLQQLRPTYRYDDELTRARKAAAGAAAPPQVSVFDAGEVVLPVDGERLTETDLDLMAAEREAYLAHLREVSLFHPWLISLGRVALVVLLSLLLWGYILAYNERIRRNPVRSLAICGLMLLAHAVAVWATAENPRLIYLTATAPTLLVGIVLAIAYDRRFALAVGALHALLVALTLEMPVEFALVLLMGVSVAVAQLDEVRTRSKLLMTGAWAGLAMALAAVAVGLATRPLELPHQWSRIWSDFYTCLATGVITGIVVQAILPAIERLFRVTTSMTLKELNDATHPLLRRLAQDAPGTYQHSLRIGDMAEAAAEAIGADALLCKVGAMYHDIGKINKPSYFVENQAGGANRHSKLSPAMSLLIIVGHVKDGIEMAREYHLPPTIRQFIETHHGTTLVEYFYHAARQQHGAQDEPAPSEFQFRYPGPKPQTKEAAILMLCDGVEGAARTLPEPNPARFEQLVHAMAQKRLTDGQFDECSITLQELHKIEQAIIKTLSAMYHGRIAYPKESLPPAEAAPPGAATA